MNEKTFTGNMPFGAMEIDTNRIFSRVGQVISVRLVTDPHTGQPRWLAFTEMASKVNVNAFGALNLRPALKVMIEAVKRHSVFLRSAVLITAAMMLVGSSYSRTPAHRTYSIVSIPAHHESEIDMEIRRVMEKGVELEKRRRQVPAIAAAFARRTDPQRACRLAALCYVKTLGTPFMPLDIAVIALAETGEFGLSAKAVSPKGALGVWQLMPKRAMSHGYSPGEMKNDEKCAEAAVRELTHKLKMAKGNMRMARKLYCGAGPAADAYEAKTRQLKREILDELGRMETGREPAGMRVAKDLS